MPTPRIQILAVLSVVLAAGCGDAGAIDEACRSNADCQDTELCAAGFCGGFGVCEPRPESCDPDAENPVCGCDGMTYQNDCFADQAGVRLATTTACVCSDNSVCVDGQFCALDDSCSNPGFCAQPPESCDTASEPVCGCDGTTYPNACTAAQAGVRVSAQGDCECESNEECGASEFCDADVCDGPGFCALRNDPACVPEGEVTGCDGVIYESACAAAEQGIRDRPQ